jgi:uracil-DNA glycosylase
MAGFLGQGRSAYSPSLLNMFKEQERDLGLPMPSHGNLTHWAEQGVLLLNNVLTVEEGMAGSHQNMGWEAITDAAVAAVAAQETPCVFLLWGSHAQKKAARVADLHKPHHLVLTAPHPSPLSAHRGFMGCGHFSKTNAFLTENGSPHRLEALNTNRPCDGSRRRLEGDNEASPPYP